MRSRAELIDNLKQRGAFWSYSRKALENINDAVVIEQGLRMGDVSDILLLFKLFSKDKIKHVWHKQLIPDKRLYPHNYYLAKVFFDIRTPENYIQSLQKKFSRYERIKNINTCKR